MAYNLRQCTDFETSKKKINQNFKPYPLGIGMIHIRIDPDHNFQQDPYLNPHTKILVYIVRVPLSV